MISILDIIKRYLVIKMYEKRCLDSNEYYREGNRYENNNHDRGCNKDNRMRHEYRGPMHGYRKCHSDEHRCHGGY